DWLALLGEGLALLGEAPFPTWGSPRPTWGRPFPSSGGPRPSLGEPALLGARAVLLWAAVALSGKEPSPLRTGYAAAGRWAPSGWAHGVLHRLQRHERTPGAARAS